MKRSLMDILACPICKDHPLDLTVFEEKEEITSGVLTCRRCSRWYPIIDEIPHMLPDDLRDKKEDLAFLTKWKSRMPQKILKEGKPFTL
ncbi:MAG: Trm112 family protein [Candidatus Bathyarchaeia archaeon]